MILATLSTFATLTSPVTASQLIATFDGFAEGFSAQTLIDGGITFANLDDRISEQPPTGSFVVENASDYPTRFPALAPYFSPPNVLSMGCHVPGSGFGFCRFGSAHITFGSSPANLASMDIFGQRLTTSDSLTLQALQGHVIVATSTYTFDVPINQTFHTTLSVSATSFDELWLLAGPNADSAVFINLDNVRVNPIPEPAAYLMLLAGLGLLGLLVTCHNRLTLVFNKHV